MLPASSQVISRRAIVLALRPCLTASYCIWLCTWYPGSGSSSLFPKTFSYQSCLIHGSPTEMFAAPPCLADPQNLRTRKLGPRDAFESALEPPRGHLIATGNNKEGTGMIREVVIGPRSIAIY